ncbi:MAG: cation:proton antiporter, partial [Gallionella sp.]|nr:cation:proton antiporter [Gallionella sp.]
LSVLINAWGFLAVFFAAVALRQTEVKLAAAAQDCANPPQTGGTEPAPSSASLDSGPAQTVSGRSLIFKEHLERLSELMLILLLGGTLFLDSWTWRAVGLALFLFMVARPVSVLASLLGTRTSWPIRGMVGWFGVRGIGSLYYLMYAIQHGLPEELALELIQLTLIAVSLSILVHGTSVKPLMGLFWRHRKRLPAE